MLGRLLVRVRDVRGHGRAAARGRRRAVSAARHFDLVRRLHAVRVQRRGSADRAAQLAHHVQRLLVPRTRRDVFPGVRRAAPANVRHARDHVRERRLGARGAASVLLASAGHVPVRHERQHGLVLKQRRPRAAGLYVRRRRGGRRVQHLVRRRIFHCRRRRRQCRVPRRRLVRQGEPAADAARVRVTSGLRVGHRLVHRGHVRGQCGVPEHARDPDRRIRLFFTWRTVAFAILIEKTRKALRQRQKSQQQILTTVQHDLIPTGRCAVSIFSCGIDVQARPCSVLVFVRMPAF